MSDQAHVRWQADDGIIAGWRGFATELKTRVCVRWFVRDHSGFSSHQFCLEGCLFSSFLSLCMCRAFFFQDSSAIEELLNAFFVNLK